MRTTILLATLALLLPAGLQAQHDHGAHASPYTDFGDRDIKALSAEETEGLLQGMGLQMALPAELNGYPGPRHVLDMASMIGLSDEQRDAVQAIFDEMQRDAQRLGAEIVEAERDLDRAFLEKEIDEARLGVLVGNAARLRGELRLAHLRAHLQVYPLLTEEQREHYDMARGYGGG